MKHKILLSLVLASSLSAQDMIAVAWTGEVHAVDSHTAATTLIGMGQFGQNAMAIDGNGTLWSTTRSGATFPFTYNLTNIDPVTGASTTVFPSLDLRGLACNGGNVFYGAQNLRANW